MGYSPLLSGAYTRTDRAMSPTPRRVYIVRTTPRESRLGVDHGSGSRRELHQHRRVIQSPLSPDEDREGDFEPAIAAMNHMPKYVVSSSPVDLAWQNSHSIGGDMPRAVTDLKDRTDGYLVVFGAGTLVRGLAEHDVVDEYRLLLFPIVLGAGKRMFDDRGHLARFRLTDSVVAPSGVVLLTYTRDKSN